MLPEISLSEPRKPEHMGFFGKMKVKQEERVRQKHLDKNLKKVNRDFEKFYEKQALRLNKKGYNRAEAEEIIHKAISKQKLVDVLA